MQLGTETFEASATRCTRRGWTEALGVRVAGDDEEGDAAEARFQVRGRARARARVWARVRGRVRTRARVRVRVS